MSSVQALPQSKSAVSKYLSLVKFSHTVFALPFAFIGFTLALSVRHLKGVRHLAPKGEIIQEPQPFQWHLLVLMLLCMIFARSAAMAFNRYLDRKFDAMNPRTAQREVPAGIIKPQHALTFTIVNCLLFVAATYFINPICFYLSPVALFVILFYSYTKRFTALCHLVLGVGLALAPIGAYLTVTGYFNWLPLMFSFAVLTWVSGFDIIYAMQDEDFDRSQQLHSIPTAFGKKGALMISNVLHVCSALFVIAAGFMAGFHMLYWIGAAFFAGLLIYQHTLVKPNDLRKVNIAFMTTNGIASIVFAVFVIADLLVY